MPAATGVEDVGSVQLGTLTKAMANADQPLIQTEYENGVIVTTGAITADRSVIIPSAMEGVVWVLRNTCTGAFSIIMKVAGQTGVTVANGKTAILVGTATDVARVTADV